MQEDKLAVLAHVFIQLIVEQKTEPGSGTRKGREEPQKYLEAFIFRFAEEEMLLQVAFRAPMMSMAIILINHFPTNFVIFCQTEI